MKSCYFGNIIHGLLERLVVPSFQFSVSWWHMFLSGQWYASQWKGKQKPNITRSEIMRHQIPKIDPSSITCKNIDYSTFDSTTDSITFHPEQVETLSCFLVDHLIFYEKVLLMSVLKRRIRLNMNLVRFYALFSCI